MYSDQQLTKNKKVISKNEYKGSEWTITKCYKF